MDEVVSDTKDGVLRLVLNRARKKNALTGAMYGALTEGLAAAGRDDAVRAVILSAAGEDFCAGNDILDFVGEFPRLRAAGAPLDELPVFRFLKALTYFEKPLIAAVQGQAVGVGVTLLLHCDLVVAADDIRLSLPFLKLGLVPEAGSTLLLPQRIGHARAFAWLALGDAIEAGDALSLGLVNKVVARERLDAAALDMAARIHGLSAAALRHTKAFLRDPDRLWQVIRAEGDVFRQLLTSPEAMAAFTAFQQK